MMSVAGCAELRVPQIDRRVEGLVEGVDEGEAVATAAHLLHRGALALPSSRASSRSTGRSVHEIRAPTSCVTGFAGVADMWQAEQVGAAA